MRNILFSLLVLLIFITACKKGSGDISISKKDTSYTPVKGAILISKVTQTFNTGASPLTIATFNYSGKQLVSMARPVFYSSSSCHCTIGGFNETTVFHYDSNGNLTGTDITNDLPPAQQVGDIKSEVTYAGNNISEIKMYLPNNALDEDVVFTYQNGMLTSWLCTTYTSSGTVSEGINYSFDGMGSNNGQTFVTPPYPGNTITYGSFDKGFNFNLAIPLWPYLLIARPFYQPATLLPIVLGAHNPLNMAFITPPFDPATFDYQYNIYGYPSSLNYNFASNSVESFSFDYIIVP